MQARFQQYPRQLWRGQRFACALLALLGAGCASTQRAEVTDAATLDLACPEVEVSEVASDRYAAYGCGRGAVYAQVCDVRGCGWGRLRHGHEQAVAAGIPPSAGREILPAPAPEPRMVLPAPYPGDVPPAPAAPPPAPPANPAPAPGPSGQLQDSSLAPAGEPVPLSQGVLSDPYQTEVPAQPLAQTVLYPPPAPLVEVQPAAPVSNYVWIGGYWWWGSANWVWVPGYWCPPYHGYSYIPGRWAWSGGYWRYGPGGWARPGTTVIVHNHVPPRASTMATVRAFTPRRVVSAGSVASSRSVVAPAQFSPRTTPLYPSTSKSVVRVAPAGGYRYEGGASSISGASSFRSGAGSRYGSGGVGRVVTPNSTVRVPSGYESRRVSPSTTYRSPSYDSFGGGRSFESRSSGHSFDSGRAYGGGGGRSSGGGGGGGRSVAPVRVSPGGGGRGHGR
jgi:hypothetical protein